MRLAPRLGNGKCAIRQIPCDCNACTNMLDKNWEIGVDFIYQPRYQTVKDLTYWSVLGFFNNWYIIKFSNKSTTGEYFDEVHKVVLYGISENMSLIVQNGKYDAVNTAYLTTLGYYVVKFVSEPYMLQVNKTMSNQVINSGDLIVNTVSLIIM